MNVNSPLVSIIVPVYNSDRYLERCIQSLINQSYLNLEIILIDDGSKDNSPIICDYYASVDTRVNVVHIENGGVSNARNKGLDIAKGDWILFCDSDDWIAVDTIESCSVFFETNDFIRFSTILHFKDFVFEKRAPIIDDKNSYLKKLISRNEGLGVCGGLYNKKLFSVGGIIRFDTSLYMGEDWVVLTRLCIRANAPIGITERFYHYNKITETSCTNTISFEKWFNCFDAFKQVKKYTLEDNIEDYTVEYNSAKIKIFLECIKSFAIDDNRSRRFYMRLSQHNYIPTVQEIINSHVDMIFKILAFITSFYWGCVLFVFAYRIIFSLKKK